MSKKCLIEFVKHLYRRMRENEVSALGAQLSYYFILSIFPFLIFLITLLDFTPLTQQDTLDQIRLLLPETAFMIVEQILLEVAAADNFTLLSLSILGTIWAASRGTAGMLKAINRAYKATETRSFFKLNAIGILLTLAMALVIMFSLSLLVFGEIIGRNIFHPLGMEEFFLTVWPALRYGIPLLIIFSVFIFLYRFGPSCRLRFRDVWPGAVFATLAWVIASQAFAFYVENFSNFSRTYGSLGGIIVFLIWLFLSSMVILLGGEINAVLYYMANGAQKSGKSIRDFKQP